MSMRRAMLLTAMSSALLTSCTFNITVPSASPDGPVKYLRFQVDGDPDAMYGMLQGDRVRVLAGEFGNWKATRSTYALDDVTVLAPTAAGKVLALAGNYQTHMKDQPPPPAPIPFWKAPSCLQRHEGSIVQPPDTDPVHYEAELVIVIGKRAKNVPVDKALDYVLGITCGNDVSARVWQKNDKQWWRAKAADTFGPCGPFIASGLDYGNLRMVLRLNGEVRQETNTGEMFHGIPETVSFISRYVTLEPGDLIFTGTPGDTQPMSIGDVVEVEIEGVGVLRNTVVAAGGA